jgi:hypothetical protein
MFYDFVRLFVFILGKLCVFVEMVNWPNLHFQARLHAAHEPGFLATRHLELVALNGGHLGFCLNLGLDLATPQGQEAASFQAALIMFCHELCALGIGHLPYQPAPHNLGPLGPIVAPAVAAAEVPGGEHHPDVDHDFVEIVGGVDPVHGPWLVDHDFVEIVGGVHPILGPWVEGQEEAVADNQPVDDDLPMDGLIGEVLGDINWDPDLEFDLDLLQ